MDDSTGPVDWTVAASVAARLARPGPVADRAVLAALVTQLRDSAVRAADEVVRVTGMEPGSSTWPAPVLVVDRPGWARANVQVLATLTGSLASMAPQLPPAARAGAGVEVGGVLALLAGRVLGQFDPFATTDGRLLLVAPNVLDVERKLRVDPTDFRLWVSLHEQTHALQFAAAPWLAAHLRGRIEGLLASLGPDRLFSPGDVGAVTEAVARALAGRDGGLLGLLEPEQRAVFDEVSATMALLEGHADVTMDQVGPRVVPTVRTIRQAFEKRRDAAAAATGLAGLARRLLGLDLKLAQYRDGAAFVRAVRRKVGVDGFNAVWSSAEALPTAAEIADPAAWVARVRP